MAAGAALSDPAASVPGERQLITTSVMRLDGEWQIATDPKKTGVAGRWFEEPRKGARPARVPGIIQEAYPGFHGVAWYWREFAPPANSHVGGRYLLRFGAVDYLASVWVNGVKVGGHEGGETPFTLDATAAIKPGDRNLLAVRVLNPTDEPIDGIRLAETPHRNKTVPYSAGNAWDSGGIVDSVELLVAPAVRVADLVVRPESSSGDIRVQVTIEGALKRTANALVALSVAPAASGETLDAVAVPVRVRPGASTVEAVLKVPNPLLWEIYDPNLYRVSARVQASGSRSFDERSVRCGFRDFRFAQGAFRLNGRRIYLRCSHTGNCVPVGEAQVSPDPDMLRRDLLNVKVMGFNAIRFIAGIATTYQLDLCDEIGLMVYEEHLGSWVLGDSAKMAERYDRSAAEMILRDRNHPSVVMWGMLNETQDGPVFRHAVSALSLVRSLDDTRLVMLNSGRFDGQIGSPLIGMEVRRTADGPDPNVTHNPTDHAVTGTGMTWQPGRLALHPGPHGEYSVVRWTCASEGEYSITGSFTGIAEKATTDVHVISAGKPLFDGFVNVGGHGNEAPFALKTKLAHGDTIDFVVGFGNANYGGDTTALDARIEGAGKVFSAADGFRVGANPNGDWSYGVLAAGPTPDSATFRLYTVGERITGESGIGSVSNPGSNQWEDVLSDQHPYQRVPHTAAIMRTLRTLGGGRNPVFLSEYGIGSAVDLWRAVRHYERIGKTTCEDARFYRDKLDRFLADWDRWKMSECFAGPEEFFAASNRRMAGQRLLGLNAIRSNPNVVGHSLTGTVDQGMTGEGLFTTFRELKPGTVDAVFEALAPLRLCAFAEPVNVYRGESVRLEIVLANEDALTPGRYRVRVQVVGPGMLRPYDRTVAVRVPERRDGSESSYVIPVLREDVRLDGPPGRYRLLATMLEGGAPTGGEAEFFTDDPATMPPVTRDVLLWGEDAELLKWFADRGIRVRAYAAGLGDDHSVILVSRRPAAGGADAWQELSARIARGAAAIFLAPEVFRQGEDSTAWLPLPRRGSLAPLPSWLYHKDEWAKECALMAGLPAGGLMNYTYYRALIPDVAFTGLDAPEEAVIGACNASIDYSSGLMLAIYRSGAGRILLNTLLIRDNLGTHPAAERLLRNMLRCV